MYVMLDGYLLPEARYAGWNRARSMADALADGGPPASWIQPDDTIADMLNAAWYARAAGPERSEAIGERAMAACRHVTLS